MEVHEVVDIRGLEDLSDTLEALDDDEDIEVEDIENISDVIVGNFIEVVEGEGAKGISVYSVEGDIPYIQSSTGMLDYISEDIRGVVL